MRAVIKQKQQTRNRNVMFVKILTLLLVILLSGCRTRYIPIEVSHSEYTEIDTSEIYSRIVKLYESKIEKALTSDSIVENERETLILKENGDTARHDIVKIIYREKTSYKGLEKKVKENDSIEKQISTILYHEKSDSTNHYVENNLTKLQKIKIRLGEMAFVVIVIFFVIFIIKIKKKFY